MDFIGRIAGLLVRPNETMGEIARRPRILEAVAIVFTFALLNVLFTIVQMSNTTMVINDPQIAGMGTPESMKTFMVIFNSIITFIVTITLWPITAGVLHVFSRMFGGHGRFIPDTMTTIGYTNLVKIPALIVVIALLLFTPPSVIYFNTPSPTPTPGPDANAYSNTTTYSFTDSLITMAGGDRLLTMIDSAVILIGTILSSLLGIFAIKHAEGLRTKDAAIVVGVPLLAYLAFTIVTYIISYIFMNTLTGV